MTSSQLDQDFRMLAGRVVNNDCAAIAAYIAKNGTAILNYNNQHTLLEYAVIDGCPEVAAFLLDNGARMDAGFDAMGLIQDAVYMMATDDREKNRAPRMRVFELLLERGAPLPNRAGHCRDMVLNASRSHSEDLLKRLQKEGLDLEVASDGETALIYMMRSTVHKTREISNLVAAGAGLDNQRKKDGKTALMVAACLDMNKARRLIELGARQDIKDPEGKTAADHAIAQGKASVYKAMLEDVVRCRGEAARAVSAAGLVNDVKIKPLRPRSSSKGPK